jgi:hypothetical protein
MNYLDNMDDWDTNELVDPEAHVSELVVKMEGIYEDLDALHAALRAVRDHLAKSMVAALVRSGELDPKTYTPVGAKLSYEIAGRTVELSVYTNGKEPTVTLVPKTATPWSEVAKRS